MFQLENKVNVGSRKEHGSSWGTPLFSGFVCAFHPAVPGSNPKHTIYAFSILYYICHCIEERKKNTQKEARFGQYFKKEHGNIS